jgi:hypothetical protein
LTLIKNIRRGIMKDYTEDQVSEVFKETKSPFKIYAEGLGKLTWEQKDNISDVVSQGNVGIDDEESKDLRKFIAKNEIKISQNYKKFISILKKNEEKIGNADTPQKFIKVLNELLNSL